MVFVRPQEVLDAAGPEHDAPPARKRGKCLRFRNELGALEVVFTSVRHERQASGAENVTGDLEEQTVRCRLGGVALRWT
jgi:hypothetical protein